MFPRPSKNIAELKKMKVLEFKHHAPFDGCFWQYEYVPYSTDGSGIVTAYNISEEKWPYKQSPQEILNHGLMELDLELGEYEWNWQYDSFQVYDWTQSLHKHLPDGWFTTFSAFADRHDLKFWWVCAECGHKTDEPPFEMAGYHGNGGVGIEVDGWLCDTCYCEQQDREDAEREAQEKAKEEQEKAAAMLEDDYDFRTWPAPVIETYCPSDDQLKLDF